MYRLTVDGDETYMIVTRNVFSHRLSVYKKYDLKVGGEIFLKEKVIRNDICIRLSYVSLINSCTRILLVATHCFRDLFLVQDLLLVQE